MPANHGMTVAVVASRLNVAISNLYRYLPGGRAAVDQMAA